MSVQFCVFTRPSNYLPRDLNVPRLLPSGLPLGGRSPHGVGSVSVEGKKAEGTKLVGYLSMPADALGPVLQMLIAGRFKYVLMDGEPLRYRKAFIGHYRLTAQHDEADYPDE
jgi:hypothetical protein